MKQRILIKEAIIYTSINKILMLLFKVLTIVCCHIYKFINLSFPTLVSKNLIHKEFPS